MLLPYHFSLQRFKGFPPLYNGVFEFQYRSMFTSLQSELVSRLIIWSIAIRGHIVAPAPNTLAISPYRSCDSALRFPGHDQRSCSVSMTHRGCPPFGTLELCPGNSPGTFSAGSLGLAPCPESPLQHWLTSCHLAGSRKD